MSAKTGAQIGVTPDDMGRDTVNGELVACSDQEIVIRRRDSQVGEVNVHFPRAGFDAAPA